MNWRLSSKTIFLLLCFLIVMLVLRELQNSKPDRVLLGDEKVIEVDYLCNHNVGGEINREIQVYLEFDFFNQKILPSVPEGFKVKRNFRNKLANESCNGNSNHFILFCNGLNNDQCPVAVENCLKKTKNLIVVSVSEGILLLSFSPSHFHHKPKLFSFTKGNELMMEYARRKPEVPFFKYYYKKNWENVKNLHWLPLGYPRDVGPFFPYEITPINKRNITCLFVGQIREERRKILEALRKKPICVIAAGMVFNAEVVRKKEYHDLLLDSKFGICLFGFDPMTFRFHETLSAGGIPLVPKLNFEDASHQSFLVYPRLIGCKPWIEISDFEKLEEELSPYLKDEKKLLKKQQECIECYRKSIAYSTSNFAAAISKWS